MVEIPPLQARDRERCRRSRRTNDVPPFRPLVGGTHTPRADALGFAVSPLRGSREQAPGRHRPGNDRSPSGETGRTPRLSRRGLFSLALRMGLVWPVSPWDERVGHRISAWEQRCLAAQILTLLKSGTSIKSSNPACRYRHSRVLRNAGGAVCLIEDSAIRFG
jgi:hypothetical protein